MLEFQGSFYIHKKKLFVDKITEEISTEDV